MLTDPEGAFVAEQERRLVGIAQAMRREGLWVLSLLAVRPDVQSKGAGRGLMQRTLQYGGEPDAGLIVSSKDPRALRLYAMSGFSLRPAFDAEGAVDRRALPRPDPRVRAGDVADLESLEPVAREIRGAPYTPELEFALRRDALLLRVQDRGFAVVQPGGGVWLLVARDDRVASSLLWSGLAEAGDGEHPKVRWITAGQDWAIDVCVRAGLRLTTSGALGVRGRPGRLQPFVPSPAFA
jgi:hypothetical protein